MPKGPNALPALHMHLLLLNYMRSSSFSTVQTTPRSMTTRQQQSEILCFKLTCTNPQASSLHISRTTTTTDAHAIGYSAECSLLETTQRSMSLHNPRPTPHQTTLLHCLPCVLYTTYLYWLYFGWLYLGDLASLRVAPKEITYVPTLHH